MLIQVPYIKQPDNTAKCGAACAAMLIKHLKNEDSDLEEIWRNIIAISPEKNREYCRTYKIGAYLTRQHFPTCTVRYKELEDFLLFCNQLGIAPILNHKSLMNSSMGHFTIAKDIQGNKVLLNDPEDETRTEVDLKLLSEMSVKLGSEDEVGGNLAIVPIPKELQSMERKCPHCNEIINISLTNNANIDKEIITDELCQSCDCFIPSE